MAITCAAPAPGSPDRRSGFLPSPNLEEVSIGHSLLWSVPRALRLTRRLFERMDQMEYPRGDHRGHRRSFKRPGDFGLAS